MTSKGFTSTSTRGCFEQRSRGNIYFHVGPVLGGQEGVASVSAAELYPRPALSQAIAARAAEVVAPRQVELVAGMATLAHEDPAGLRTWFVPAVDVPEVLGHRIGLLHRFLARAAGSRRRAS